MSDFVTIPSKGQMVIPARLRKALKIKPGTRMSVQQVDGHLELYPVTPDYIDSLCGILGDTSDMIASLIRDHESEDID